MGRIASYYYLHFKTVKLLADRIGPDNNIESVLHILSETSEYDDLPVRHNEDKLNEQLAEDVPFKVDPRTLDSPHTKTFLLLQAHFSKAELPIVDYVTDTRMVLDQAVRILQAMVDVAADNGWINTTLNTMYLMQMIVQGRWYTDSPLLTLPHLEQRKLLSLLQSNVNFHKQILFYFFQKPLID
jgi:activating signal cointegrator complex subunit 3